MGLFNRKPQEPPPERPSAGDQMALARQLQAQPMQWQAQAMQQAAAVQQASAGGAAVGFHDVGPPGAGDPGARATGLCQALHCSHCDTPMNAGNIDVLPGPGMAVAAAG